MQFTKEEIQVIWLALWAFQPCDEDLIDLSAEQQAEISRQIREKIFTKTLDSIDNNEA
jgi:hypothetical protein